MSESERLAEARRWLRFAQEDLAGADGLQRDPGAIPRHVCWLSQQATEKALKAALIYVGTDFPRQHDLDLLRNLLPSDWPVTREYRQLGALSGWAIEARYPSDLPEPSSADAAEALRQARGVVQSVLCEMERRGFVMGDPGPHS